MSTRRRRRRNVARLSLFEALEARLLLSTVPPTPIDWSNQAIPMNLITPLLGMQIHTAAWGDVNGDGLPDLFVGSFQDSPAADFDRPAGQPGGPYSGGSQSNVLLINNGPNAQGIDTFHVDKDTQTLEGLALSNGRTSGAVFADFNNDGKLDLLVVNNTYPENYSSQRLGDHADL